MNYLSSKQLTEWIAFDNIDPIGKERDDLRSGIIASTIANIYRKKGAKPFKPDDFILKFRSSEKPKKKIVNLRQQTINVMNQLIKNQNKKKK